MPSSFDRREDALEDGGACCFADLKPTGGLYGRGPARATLKRHWLVLVMSNMTRISHFSFESFGFISLVLSVSVSESESEDDEPDSEVSSSLDSCAFESFLRFFSCLVVGSGEADPLELLPLSDAMTLVRQNRGRN